MNRRPPVSAVGTLRLVLMALVALVTFIAPSGASGQAGVPGLDGTVVVLNKSGASASFIDLASGRIVASAPTGEGPHELVISADGRTAVATDYGARTGGSSLTVLDVAAGRRLRTLDLSPYSRPHGIVFLPGDSLVAVTAEADRAVLVVRIADGEILQVLDTQAGGSHMVAVTADGRTLWTGDIASNTVTELDRETGARVRALSAPAQPEAVNVTPDGHRVFAGSNATGRVTAFHTADGASETVAEGFGWPYRVFLTPGVERIVIPDLRGEVVRVFDGETYAEMGRLNLPGDGPQGLTLHPDGRHLFLSLSASNRVAVVDLETLEVVAHLPTGAGPDGIGYSSVRVRR